MRSLTTTTSGHDEPAKVVLLGAGGHAREIHALMEISGRRLSVLGYVVQAEFLEASRPRNGWERRVTSSWEHFSERPTHFVAAVGDPELRRRLVQSLAEDLEPIGLVMGENLSPHTAAASGLVTFTSSAISTDVQIGQHVHVNWGARVSHDVNVGDYVTIGPGAVIAGHASLADGVHIGANATVLPGRDIGPGSVIGAGAVVTRDVPAHTTVVGNPARPLAPRASIRELRDN